MKKGKWATLACLARWARTEPLEPRALMDLLDREASVVPRATPGTLAARESEVTKVPWGSQGGLERLENPVWMACLETQA